VPVAVYIVINSATQPDSGKLIIYPNPVRNTLLIASENPVELITVHTSEGLLVSEQKTSDPFHAQIDTHNLSPGIYLLTIINQDGRQYKGKFVVIK
jgi:hypothetical protein